MNIVEAKCFNVIMLHNGFNMIVHTQLINQSFDVWRSDNFGGHTLCLLDKEKDKQQIKNIIKDNWMKRPN